ncbi:protein phosphatase regulator like HEAT repeat-containing protein [Cryptosporidium canis]|uniref:Protein phosphatase regulator like HEAT repeat-containing protein n=1 Tax=Cryptosporidium canis TaxID=195482 RepID=A0ABQ8P4M6_9CRYT|nr:protein phosphatase regulator like HEAT repeat-containing protein [Cryptosporidium canis]KAJ1615226.1 protein phosphatase regulator like HEAT repeat-containing protein [Cryptosporidium canis]
MSQIQNKRKICVRVADVCSYNRSFDEFIKTRDSKELHNTLVSCLNSSAIVKNAEGQVFISRLVSELGHDFHVELVNIIKANTPKLSSNLLVCYGEILHKIWLVYVNQNEETKMHHLEEIIQSNFCMGSIRLNPIMALRMRLILHSFHNSRDDIRVNKLLIRLYDPIIWRYLSVANWKVRLNTTALLAILFPLIDPSLSNKDYNYELDNQFSLLHNLLIDNNSEVRVAAIQSVCRILTLFWEIIPIERINDVLMTLSSKCIEDRSSSDVRVAVVNGISVIVSNPLSQSIIRRYLSKVFNYIHDFDIEVRYSVALLILKISRIKGFDYSQIISKKQILSRISKEFIIYQLRQSTYYMKYGKLSDGSKVEISDMYSDDQDLVFESLKVARVLAELLNPSIFNGSTREQLKNCHLFCDLCPIGMVGYFCSLNILVDEKIGKNIENSDLLRLAVLLITTTVENCKKNRITQNKAKILLASSREILSIVFSSDLFLEEFGNEAYSSSSYGDEAKRIAVKTAIKFFTKSCNDEFFVGLSHDYGILISVMQLLQHPTVFNSDIYPQFSKYIVSELLSHSLDILTSGMDKLSLGPFHDTAILLLKNWGLLDDIILKLAEGSHCILTDESELSQLNAVFEAKLSSKESGALCIKVLESIFKYSSIRTYLSNNRSAVICIQKLATFMLSLQIDFSSVLDEDMAKHTQRLLIYCFSILKSEDDVYELILIIVRNLHTTAEHFDRSYSICPSLIELLGYTLCILNSKVSEKKEVIREIVKLSENLSVILSNLFEIGDQNKVLIYKFQRGARMYLFALRQILGSSNFDADSCIQEFRSKLDKSPEISI